MFLRIVACFLREWFVNVGRDPEDGTDIIQSLTQVVAETPSGRRFIYNGDPMNHERFCGRVEEAGVINLEYWSETYPAYGSQAWVQDEPEMAYRERMDAERGLDW